MEKSTEVTTVRLRKSVFLADLEFSELQLREPTVGEWLEFDSASGVAADIIAISIVSGVPRTAVEKIGVRDLIAASNWIGRFFSPTNIGRTTAPETERTITLRKPVQLGDNQYTELTLREPTAAEWREYDALAGVAADVKSVSLVSGLPIPVIRTIGVRDFIEASEWLGRFLEIAPQTGGE